MSKKIKCLLPPLFFWKKVDESQVSYFIWPNVPVYAENFAMGLSLAKIFPLIFLAQLIFFGAHACAMRALDRANMTQLQSSSYTSSSGANIIIIGKGSRAPPTTSY